MRYLARTHSSPLVAFATPSAPSTHHEAPINLATKASVDDRDATGVVYDESMLRHHCPCQDNAVHLENPSRIQVCAVRGGVSCSRHTDKVVTHLSIFAICITIFSP